MIYYYVLILNFNFKILSIYWKTYSAIALHFWGEKHTRFLTPSVDENSN